jgi:hypothetical protein
VGVSKLHWKGAVYEFDARKCYQNGGQVRLPDGTVLEIWSWKMIDPPLPAQVRLAPPKRDTRKAVEAKLA